MKLNRKNLLLAAAISLTLTAPSAFAATFTFSGTAAGSYDWAAGTDWDATPASNLDTILNYTSALADSIAIISNNDVASPPFQLNQLNFTNDGPATGTAPTLALLGGQLELISNTFAATPVLSFNTTGTVPPIISIANNLLLTNDLGVAVADLTSATLSGAISGAGALNKTGLGALTLSGANNYNGLTTISGGNLTLDNASALGGGANVTFAGGALAYTAASSAIDLSNRIKNSSSLVILRPEGQNVNYTGSIDNSNTAGFQVASNGIGVGGMLTVSAANNYSGDTFIGNTNPPGTQDAASITVSGAGKLGSGTIFIGRNGNSNGSLLALTGGASLTNAITLNGRGNTNINIQNLAGTSTLSGPISLASGGGFYAIQSDAGLLQLTNPTTLAIGIGVSSARTVTLQGAGNGLITGTITNGSQPLSLAKAGAGTWTLSALSATPASNYTGTTIINEGTLAITTTNPSLTGGLTFGSTAGSANTGTLDLTSANATFSSSLVQTNTAGTNTITIGSGKTLTLTGSAVSNVLTVGGATTGSARLQVTGATPGVGTLTVTDATRNLVVASTNGTTATTQTMDLSGLGTFNATIAGLYVGRPSSGAGAGTTGRAINDSLTLAGNNTITASGTNGIVVGGSTTTGSGTTTPAKLILGTANVLNSTQFVIGHNRISGSVQFNTGLTNPSVTIRGALGGATRTNIYMGDQGVTRTGISTSGGGSTTNLGTMNFTGGTVDARIEGLFVGLGAGGASPTRPGGNGNFTMDGASSIVDINTLVIAQNVNANNVASGTVSTGTFTVTNGTLLVNTAATLANDIDTTATTDGTENLSATFTVAGGTATIGASGGSPEHLILGNHVNAGNPGLATATVSLTGGTLNVFGDIKEGNLGDGTITSSLALNGASAILDMKGNSIGTSGAPINSLTFASGTLKNVGEINGGGLINKTTAGSLTLSGPNTFTGGLDLFNGELKITQTGSLGIGVKTVNIQNAAYITLDGTAGAIVLPATTSFTTAGLAFLNTVGNNSIAGAIAIVTGNATTTVTNDGGSLTLTGAIAPGPAVTTARNLELAGTSTGANLCSGAITDGALTTLSVVKSGTGNWSLTNTGNNYSGNTTVNEGTLTIAGAASAADANPNNNSSTVTIAATGATLNLTYSGTDKVDKLFIGGVQQPAGIYGPTATAIPGKITNSSGTGTLTVLSNPPAGYASWASLNGATADRSADHDFDGVSNGVEFFIGGPTGNTTGFTPLPGVVDTAGVLSVTWTKAAGYTGTYGTDFVVETSATLTGVWATESSPGTVAIGATTVTYTFPAGTKNFARLKVTGP